MAKSVTTSSTTACPHFAPPGILATSISCRPLMRLDVAVATNAPGRSPWRCALPCQLFSHRFSYSLFSRQAPCARILIAQWLPSAPPVPASGCEKSPPQVNRLHPPEVSGRGLPFFTGNDKTARCRPPAVEHELGYPGKDNGDDMPLEISELKESNDFLNTLLDQITSAVFIADEHMRIHSVNNALQTLFFT
jgi:hypothetical protein